MRNSKKFFAVLLGGISALSLAQARSKECPPASAPDTPPGQEQVKYRFSKQELIDELKRLCRDPQKIKVVSAMCYDMAVPPDSIEYECSCGAVTSYPRAWGAGKLVEELPYIKRMFAAQPYKITVNSDGLCSACAKSDEQRIVVTVSCFNCGKTFTWYLHSLDDVEKSRWLAVHPPVQELDANTLGLGTFRDGDDSADSIKDGARYILDHVFCPDCAKAISIDK